MYNAKSRYFKVTPSFIHYNTDIFGMKQGTQLVRRYMHMLMMEIIIYRGMEK